MRIEGGRVTYRLYGLKQIIDLGQWWEAATGAPIPLGAIIAKRSLGIGLIGKIDNMIRSSIDYAFSHREETYPYIKKHSQELADEVIGKHIDLYVNDYSLDIGGEGLAAVGRLMYMAEERGIFDKNDKPLFIV